MFLLRRAWKSLKSRKKKAIVFLLGLLLGRIFFDALVLGSSRISERLRFHPYVLVVFRASILPVPGVKEQTSIYPKREVNVADVILD